MKATATYSAQDNKLRLYFDARLPEDVYLRVRDAGYRWACKQECFVAPMWTPEREDLALSFLPEGHEIEDEDITLEERAAMRADRFARYESNRIKDATMAVKAAKDISTHIPFGQPILVGHHSEKRSRRDAERIESNMIRAAQMWDTADYWNRRADAVLKHATFKERPDVRFRRRKGIIADKARVEKRLAIINKILAFTDTDPNYIDTMAFLNDGSIGYTGLYYKLKDEGKKALPEALAKMASQCWINKGLQERWLNHYNRRIAYETTCLQGWEPAKAEKAVKAMSPLLNINDPDATPMTMAEWKRSTKCSDAYQVRERNLDGTWAKFKTQGDYRHRCVLTLYKGECHPVFITDAKAHKLPPSSPKLADSPALSC